MTTDQWDLDDLAPDPSDDALEREGLEDEPTSTAMFEGDGSTIYPEQRRCLHALLKHRYISADKYPEHWAVLLANEELIKSRLNDIFFDLVVERSYQVAFKRQARTDSDDPLPTLLQDRAHTKEETIVLMFLRQRFFAQRQDGDNAVFVERSTLLDEVATMRPEDATHRAMDQKRATKAIDGLATAGVLLKTGDTDRFRISPIIEVLLPVETLLKLQRWLMAQNGTDALTPEARESAYSTFDAEFDLDSEIEDGAGGEDDDQ
ncbi:DUF4194 domain-containing protein [Kribbella sp. NPDC051718]|uniref:DUF4194 domain-containing protein n=1 Tax=Kribbella sp. NPDC051718 TaxID=3155168 RepID=UPI00343C0000